jgi:hypothetical protein
MCIPTIWHRFLFARSFIAPRAVVLIQVSKA